MAIIRNEGIPQILQLVGKDDYAGAFAVATEVERYSPHDPVLSKIWSQFSTEASITTSPDGAEVYVQPYATPDKGWESLGRTPIVGARLARGTFRFKVEKAGYEPRVLAANNPGPLLQNLTGRRGLAALIIALVPKSSTSDMVPVSGGAFPVGLTGFNTDVPIDLQPFSIDRHETTNREYKQFVDRGGYAKAEYWRQLERGQFVDSTGRPGPSTWELGEYPPGQADYPVGGVSWDEAVAYCRSLSKELPTVFHWARAALSPVEIGSPLAPAIIPLSNFSGKGVAAVESYRGVGPFGTYDMAGNAREWVWNAAANGRRWILGGAWNDPDYMFTVPNSLPPLDRAASNGFRCAAYGPDATVPDALLARVETYSRDNRTAKAVSNEVFDVFRRQYAHVKSALNERVESTDTKASDWIRRWDSFSSLQGEEYLRTFRTRMGQWRQDLARVLDVLTARSDIDKERIAYYGASFGASTAFPLIALEDRIKVAVLGPAGFTYRELPPEADAINYVSRVSIPVLMMGGNHDYIFPPETAQKPMFERLGTPPEHKRHVVFDAGHGNFPRSEMIREVLGWLDRYLGPVKSSNP